MSESDGAEIRRAPKQGKRAIMGGAMRLVVGFVLFLLAGNLLIVAAWGVAHATAPGADPPEVPGVPNLQVVDAQVWRGAAPSEEGYRSLARHGVTTVVDLRAEEGAIRREPVLHELGIRHVSIALRDGQTPTRGQVDRFLRAVRRSKGVVFVHCGAGVGRTGAMSAAYLVSSGGASAGEALRRNLAVGPPSLEQIAFVADFDSHDVERPSWAVTAVSRLLDAPRRLWTRLRVADLF